MTSILNRILCSMTNMAAVNGASLFIWGEKEIPESLRAKYEELKEDKNYEND